MALLTTEKKLESPEFLKIQNRIITQQYKKKNLWRVIAKNEIRVRTSSFRNHRKAVFIIIYALLFSWALIIAPLIFDMFMPTLAVNYSAIFKPVVAILIETLMMTFFLILVMYPLNNIYREMEVGFKESILATPVKSKDIFLGEFLGKSPIYSMMILILAPIIVSMVNPIIDLTIVQYIVIYGCVFGMVYFANLVGSIIASWFEHKISKSEKARDLGKALIMIFAIVLVIMMYAVLFFLNELMSNPELKNWLAFYPSLWFSNIILYSIDPVLLNSFVLNIWANLLLVIIVPIFVLYMSYQKAGSFYSLEGGIEKSSIAVIEHENIFYKSIRKIIGRKWAGLTVMQLKRFLRKKANFAKIAYVIGLLGFFTWFIGANTDEIFGNTFGMTILIAIGGGVGSMMLGHLGFVDSKDLIWVYKRSPRGIKGLVYSYLIAMFILNLIISAAISIIFNIFAHLDLINTIIFFVEFAIFSQITMFQAMGIECISPAYGEKDSNMKSNNIISMLLLQPLLFIPIMLLIFIDIEPLLLKTIIIHGIIFLYNIVTSIPLLIYGMKKLNNLE